MFKLDLDTIPDSSLVCLFHGVGIVADSTKNPLCCYLAWLLGIEILRRDDKARGKQVKDGVVHVMLAVEGATEAEREFFAGFVCSCLDSMPNKDTPIFQFLDSIFCELLAYKMLDTPVEDGTVH